MEETVVVVVVVQEAKMGQSIDSGRVLGAAVETQKQQHCRSSYFLCF
jgi:ribosomal protein L14